MFSLTFLTEVQILAGHHAPVTGGVFYPGEKNTHYTYRLRVSLSWQLEKGRGKDVNKTFAAEKQANDAVMIAFLAVLGIQIYIEFGSRFRILA